MLKISLKEMLMDNLNKRMREKTKINKPYLKMRRKNLRKRQRKKLNLKDQPHKIRINKLLQQILVICFSDRTKISKISQLMNFLRISRFLQIFLKLDNLKHLD